MSGAFTTYLALAIQKKAPLGSPSPMAGMVDEGLILPMPSIQMNLSETEIDRLNDDPCA